MSSVLIMSTGLTVSSVPILLLSIFYRVSSVFSVTSDILESSINIEYKNEKPTI
jgi:hypothetical protein